MSCLVRAGFSRLFRCRGLYASVIFSAVTAALFLNRRGTYWGEGSRSVCDFYFCEWLAFFPIAASIVTCFFCADDYRGGAIRSKITVGCKKAQIYLSNLIVCSFGTLISFAAGLIACVITAALRGAIWLSSPAETLYVAAVTAVIIIGSAAFALIFSMFISRPAAAVTAVLIISIGAAAIASGTAGYLNQPEYRISPPAGDYELYESVTDGVTDYDEMVDIAKSYGWAVENPYYIGGVKRAVAYLAYLLPGSQSEVAYSAVDDAIYLGRPVMPALRAPVPCALFSALITALGAAAFSKKNIN